MIDLSNATAVAAALAYTPQPILKAAWAIVDREGGFVDDAADAGGATNHGVSLRWAVSEGLAFDLNGDGVVDADDIHLVTPAIAAAAFILGFFNGANFNVLPACLQAECFDMAVNSGPGTAAILAQRAINELGAHPRLAEDGKIGAMTCEAAHRMLDAHGAAALVNAYVDVREGYYAGVVRAHPEDAKFLRGWNNRAESFRVA